jgi:hypothetical protein
VAQRREDIRAADSDRQFVADRLREALNEGRLDLGEYDDRLKQAYAARTYGELDTLLHDLPTVVPAERAQLATTGSAQPAATGGPPYRRRQIPVWLQATWGSWLTCSLVCVVIWLATSPGGYPWPVWVAGPWGAILLARTIMALGSGDPEGYLKAEQEREERRRRQKRARRERRRYR